MKRLALFFLVPFLLLPLAQGASAQSEQNQTSAAEARIAPWHNDDAPGVAVAVRWQGDTVLATGAGMANLEHGAPITPDTRFHAASVSKQFTAFSILLLVSDGLIDMDEDIRVYLPELQPRARPVTIRHLLDHTGGYREMSTLTAMGGWLEDDIRTRGQLLNLLSRQTGQNFAAGDHVEYSNSGYFMLAEIVGRVSGQSFAEFTKSRIFEPLGMNQTHFRTDRTVLIPGLADSYAVTGTGFGHLNLLSETIGSTGIITTVTDLLKWADNFQTHRVGSPDVFDLMAERSVAADGESSVFARGHELRPYKGFDTWSHGGRIAGYRSFLLRVPEADFVVSILSNRDDFDTARLGFALADLFLKDLPQYVEPETETWSLASAEELASYAGNYELYPGVIFSIRTENGQLEFGMFNDPEMSVLPQEGPAAFTLNPASDLSFVFETGENGTVDTLYYQIGLHGRLKARRIELAPFDPASTDLAAYTGTYSSPELMTRYEFVMEGDTLIAKHQRMPDAPLVPYQTDTFLSSGGHLQKTEFVRDAEGKITGVLASTSVSNNVLFERMP